MKKRVMLCMLLPLVTYAMDMELDDAALHAFLSALSLQHILEDAALTPQHKIHSIETGLREHTNEIDNPIQAVTNAFNCVVHDCCVKKIAQEIKDDSERALFIEKHTASAGHYIQE
jgi:hypothetical protein